MWADRRFVRERTNYTIKTISLYLGLAGGAACNLAAQDTTPVEHDRQMGMVCGYKDGMGLVMDVLTLKQDRHGAGILVIVSGRLISNRTLYGGEKWQEKKPVVAELLRHGHVLFIAKPGGAPKYTLPEITQDMPRAVRFLRHHAARSGIDANQIGVTGATSGHRGAGPNDRNSISYPFQIH